MNKGMIMQAVFFAMYPGLPCLPYLSVYLAIVGLFWLQRLMMCVCHPPGRKWPEEGNNVPVGLCTKTLSAFRLGLLQTFDALRV
jgi:hypothetical protein